MPFRKRPPFVAALVQYSPGDLEHGRQLWHAALITKVYTEDMVDLMVVFSDADRGAKRTRVIYSDKGHAGWRWPPEPEPERWPGHASKFYRDRVE